jgi:hypothetical protein
MLSSKGNYAACVSKNMPQETSCVLPFSPQTNYIWSIMMYFLEILLDFGDSMRHNSMNSWWVVLRHNYQRREENGTSQAIR